MNCAIGAQVRCNPCRTIVDPAANSARTRAESTLVADLPRRTPPEPVKRGSEHLALRHPDERRAQRTDRPAVGPRRRPRTGRRRRPRRQESAGPSRPQYSAANCATGMPVQRSRALGPGAPRGQNRSSLAVGPAVVTVRVGAAIGFAFTRGSVGPAVVATRVRAAIGDLPPLLAEPSAPPSWPWGWPRRPRCPRRRCRSRS